MILAFVVTAVLSPFIAWSIYVGETHLKYGRRRPTPTVPHEKHERSTAPGYSTPYRGLIYTLGPCPRSSSSTPNIPCSAGHSISFSYLSQLAVDDNRSSNLLTHYYLLKHRRRDASRTPKMCHLFVACSLNCPDFEKKWQPRLLSCSTAREHSRGTFSREVYPCGNVTTLWNEDLCPYCLTAQLSKGSSKYVRDILMKHPLRYTPVEGRGGMYMRWSGRAREEFDIEWRMENRPPRKLGDSCGGDSKCKCGCGKGGTGEEYLLEKPREKSRLASKWFGRVEEPVVERVKKEKETRYECQPDIRRKETDYTCKPVRKTHTITPERERRETAYLRKTQRQTTETRYKCKPTKVTERYYTNTSPCGKIVYYETETERRKREKEEDRAYEKYCKGRRSERRTTYRRNGHDIEVEVEVEKPRTKSVSFSNFDKHYYGNY